MDTATDLLILLTVSGAHTSTPSAKVMFRLPVTMSKAVPVVVAVLVLSAKFASAVEVTEVVVKLSVELLVKLNHLMRATSSTVVPSSADVELASNTLIPLRGI